MRRLSHEFFHTMHILASLVFVAACYDHFEDLLDSWKYLHATLAIMGAAFFYRVGAVAWFSRCFSRPETAKVEALDDGALAITIDLKSGTTWTAGQHVFLRFLTLHPWSTHPFTIASLDSSLVPGSSASRTMRFVLRPHSGLTARLLSRTNASPSRSISFPVLLDGPYGASPAQILQGADEAFFVAGGTGISFVLPLLSALVHAAELHIVKRATLVWAVPRAECVEWVRDELEQIVRAMQELDAENEKVDGGEKGVVALTSTLRRVKLEVYVTRGSTTGDDKFKVESNASGASGSFGGIDGVDIRQGRPDVGSLVQHSVTQAKGRLAVVSAWLRLLRFAAASRADGAANSMRPAQPSPRGAQHGRPCAARHRHGLARPERQGRRGDRTVGGELRALSRMLLCSFGLLTRNRSSTRRRMQYKTFSTCRPEKERRIAGLWLTLSANARRTQARIYPKNRDARLL